VLQATTQFNRDNKDSQAEGDTGNDKPRERLRVLIVEDNLDTVHTLARVLQEQGHQVDYAINGYAAMELARRFRPNYVLLDLGLPGMDGFDVCRRMRREEGLKETRIIAVTGYAQEEYRQRSRDAGCDLHLVKPLDPRVLEKLLS
jgi:DNA-binding response OmpR family regulator